MEQAGEKQLLLCKEKSLLVQLRHIALQSEKQDTAQMEQYLDMHIVGYKKDKQNKEDKAIPKREID